MANLTLQQTSPISEDDQIELVHSFYKIGDNAKALQICDIALKLYPSSVSLAILKKTILENEQSKSKPDQDDLTLASIASNQDLLVHRVESIANVFSQNNKRQEAYQLYKLIKKMAPRRFLAYFRLGLLYFEDQNYDLCIEELSTAHEIDPFHIFTLKKLGLALLMRDQADKALNYWIDGLIITLDSKSKQDIHFFQTHIQDAQLKIPGFTKQYRNDVFKKRHKRLKNLILELNQSIPTTENSSAHELALDHWVDEQNDENLNKPQKTPLKNKSLIDLPESTEISILQNTQKDPLLKQHKHDDELQSIAQKLRHYPLFKNLNDEERLNIANFTSFISVKEDSYVFHEGEPSYGIYFIDRGIIEYLNHNLSLLFSEGQLFAHENLLIHEKNMFTAKVKKECDLIFIDKAGLGMIFSRNKKLAIHFLWYFWKSLLFQYQELRQMLLEHYRDNLYIQAKIEHLPSISLSQKQLAALTTISNHEVFPKNSILYNMGEDQLSLSVVLEGKVKLIHKDLDSYFQKGQYFGEAFLADSMLKSSFKAKSVENDSKVILINHTILKEIMAHDERSVYDFLTVLCRMLAYKLKSLKNLA